MAYRAFVVGADYHLNFAVADARRIAAALQTLGYELPDPLIPPPEEDNTAVAERFKKLATKCGPEDTLLFFFAGHGLVHNGLLYLLLQTYDPAYNPLQTCLSANDLSTAFQASDAGRKLMILDCCHAGEAFRLADFNFLSDYLVLTASQSFEKALEFKDRKAGFLSYHLHNALTKDLAKVIHDSRVSLNALHTYLRRKVQEHNRASPDKVSEITVVSKQQHDMLLAELTAPYLNLSGLVCVNPAFLAAECVKTGPYYTPENFYGALPPAQWWGVANGLVAEQTLYLTVEQHVRHAINAYPPLTAVLHGSGGMGKSVLLRRLGVSLACLFGVWWLDDPETLLEEREDAQNKLLESGRPQLILIDDWSALDPDTRKGLRAWFQQLAKSGNGQYLKFALTSRYWKPEELPLKLIYANSLFDFDKLANLAKDNQLLLDKAVVQLSVAGWECADRELRTPQMAQTKPFHLLFVFMRLAEDIQLRAKVIAERGKTLNFEHIFQDIIQDDLENLWRDPYKRGLAAAVSMAAYLHMQYHSYLGKTALLTLAEHYNPGYPLLSASEPADWGTVKYYLYTYRSPINKRKDAEDFVAFIKDEFAEAFIAADRRGHRHVENRWVRDLEFLVCEADDYSSSYLILQCLSAYAGVVGCHPEARFDLSPAASQKRPSCLRVDIAA